MTMGSVIVGKMARRRIASTYLVAMLALPLALVLALQLPPAPDSIYATGALREMVARAAAANRVVPPALRSYRARTESELALVLHRPEGDEGAMQVEQVASAVRWTRDGSYEQRVVGYRAQSVGLTLSTVSYFRRAWTVPVLSGNRLTLFFGARDTTAADSAKARRRRPRRGDVEWVIHPFAEDRDSVYRFTGGDTVATLRVAGRAIPIARIRVQPRRAPRQRTLVFDGDVEIDAARGEIVRMRGRLVAVGGRTPLRERILRAGAAGVAYMELENAEVEGEFWLPSYQRVEVQAVTPLSDARSVVRIVTRFRDYVVNDARDTAGVSLAADGADTLAPKPHRLTFAPRDSVSAWSEWRHEPGDEAAATDARDFDDIAPGFLRPTGPPVLSLRARRLSELLRYDRVEGLYTGLAATLRLRDAAPGTTVSAWGGWAWEEQTVRGGIEALRRRGPWLLHASAARSLDNTNDFLGKFDDRAADAFFGGDPFDYVDRRSLLLGADRELRRRERTGPAPAIARIEVGTGSDRGVTRNLREPAFGRDTFRVVRPVARGSWVRTAAELELHPEVSGELLQPGLGALVRYERGDGELAWQRVEARLLARRIVGPLTLAARGDVGALLGSAARPPQQLFELGSTQGLPGYGYKEFAGDQAALARATATYDLGLSRAPIRLTRRIILPSLSPSPSVGIQAGWTGATARGRAALAALSAGAMPPGLSSGNVPVEPLAWRTTDGVRATVDVRLRFFGGAVSIGVARPIDHGARWRVVGGLGGTL
ncbi:MAG TPA: hypothetical protein VFS05_07225 [Gemmatimonadaceae bacterium]|nr:hypothetical protein [Gemmatimonadaceae bacterium]